MTFQPKYRGTREALEAESTAALRWFYGQIAAEMPGDDMGDVTVRHSIERNLGGAWVRGSNSYEYFHVFRMKKPHHRWGEVRFVVRKNGTINLERAVECAKADIARKVRQEKQRNVLDQNKAIWAEYSGDGDLNDVGMRYNIRLSLSRSEVGRLTVRLENHEWGFRTEQTIEIRRLTAFFKWAEGVKQQIKEGW